MGKIYSGIMTYLGTDLRVGEHVVEDGGLTFWLLTAGDSGLDVEDVLEHVLPELEEKDYFWR